MKRSFSRIRDEILHSLVSGPKSITKIAQESNMTWKTAQRHLLWLEKVEEKVTIVRKSKRKIVYKKTAE